MRRGLNMRDLLVRLLVFAALSALVACSERTTLWVEDIPFSEGLTAVAETYEKANGISAAEYVDAVVIYQLDAGDGRHPNLSTLRRKTPVYESRDPETVRRLLGAAASEVNGPDACLTGSGPGAQYYVAAYDRVLMRVGSFRSQICETENRRFATVRPTGGAAIYLSNELAGVLDELAPGAVAH